MCASFHCSFNAGEPYTFVIYEAFDDDGAALDAHRQTEHYKAMSEFKKREFFGALGDAHMRKEHYKAMSALKKRSMKSCKWLMFFTFVAIAQIFHIDHTNEPHDM